MIKECEEECNDYLDRAGEFEVMIKFSYDEAQPAGSRERIDRTINFPEVDSFCDETTFEGADFNMSCNANNRDQVFIWVQESPNAVGDHKWTSLPRFELLSTGGGLGMHRNYVVAGPALSTLSIDFQGLPGRANVAGVIDYSVGPDPRYAQCPQEGCRLLLHSVFLKAQDFSVEGVSVADVTLRGGDVEGIVSPNGQVTIPASEFFLQTNFKVGDKQGSVAVQPEGNVTGTFNFEDYTLDLDEFTASNDDIHASLVLKSSRVAHPPEARINVEAEYECNGTRVASATVDGGASFDVDEDLHLYLWRLHDGQVSQELGHNVSQTVGFPLGLSYLMLNVYDSRGGIGKQLREVSVVDTTAPTLQLSAQDQAYGCQQGDTPLIPPVVADICSPGVSLEAYIVSQNGSLLEMPVNLGPDYAMPNNPGSYVVEWRATDESGNQSQVQQPVVVGAGIMANGQYDIADSAGVVNSTGALLPIVNIGGGETGLGKSSNVGTVFSGGNLLLRSDTTVHGDAFSRGSISYQGGANVLGQSHHHSTVSLPFPPTYTAAPAASGSVHVNSGATLHLSPGAYGDYTVNSGGTLVLAPGSYGFDGLTLNQGTTLVINGDVHLTLMKSWAHRGGLVRNNGAVVRVVYLGQNQVTFDSRFVGHIVAPRSTLAFQEDFVGTVYAKNLQVRPGVTLTCQD